MSFQIKFTSEMFEATDETFIKEPTKFLSHTNEVETFFHEEDCKFDEV